LLRSLFLLLLLSGAARAEELEPRLPNVSSIYPQGSTAGANLRAELLGQYLDRAQHVVFLDPAIQGKIVEGSYTRLTLDLQVSQEAKVGAHYFRVISPRGASNLTLFRVGDLPHLAEAEPNGFRARANPISLPVVVNGRLEREDDIDFYSFRAAAGDRWIFDLYAARNGNGLDAAVIVLNERGQQIAHSEDVFIWDPFLEFTFPEEGRYYAVIQANRSRDPTYAYQLHIRRSPQLESVSPLGIRPGESTEATVFGAGLRGRLAAEFDDPALSAQLLEARGSAARLRIQASPAAPAGPRAFRLRNEGGLSNYAQLVVDPRPVHPGRGDLEFPAVVHGIARYRDPEAFHFTAQAGEILIFEVEAQRYGSPADSYLRLLDAQGKQLAVNDDANVPGVAFSKDSRLEYIFEGSGRYTLELRNLTRTRGENYPYRLVARRSEPQFDAMVARDRVCVDEGGKGKLRIQAVRQDGFDGEIELRVRGLPPGVAAAPAVIPAGKADADVVFTAQGNASPGVFAPIEVEATGQPAGALMLKRAWSSVRLSSGGGEGHTFFRHWGAMLAVCEKPLFALEALATNLNLVRGGKVEFGVSIRRAEGFDAPLEFFLENLPAGVSLEPAAAPAGAKTAILVLRASAEAERGRASMLAILARARIDGREWVEEAPKISMRVD